MTSDIHLSELLEETLRGWNFSDHSVGSGEWGGGVGVGSGERGAGSGER